MRKKPSFPALLVNFILVLTIATIWIAFGPTQLGGQASYVMINGNSMEPGFHLGDLAIVKAASDYSIGDVVTYNDPLMKANIIHRIIGMDGDRFVLKGDNNGWVDAYHPTQTDIVGKLWIHAPKLASALQWLRTPVNMALSTGLLGGILMASIYLEPGKTGKNKKKSSGGSMGGILEPALYVLGSLFLGFLVLSIYAFNQPLIRNADDIKFQQAGLFSYTASAVPGIYDKSVVSSGDPIFPKLTCAMTVGFNYHATGDGLQNISGMQSLTATIQDEGSGWQRNLALTPETPFSGDSFFSKASVDLCQIQALIDTVEKQTGFEAGSYTLTITPHVSMLASAAGQELQDNFDAKLAFQFDKVHFYMLKSSVDGVDPLTSSKASVVKSAANQLNTLPILGQKIAVFDLRAVALAGLTLALAGSLLTGWAVYSVSQQDPEAYNRLRYGALVIDVNRQALERLSNVIEVANLEDLAKLAERQNTMILHVAFGSQHTYFVQSEGSSYRITTLAEAQDSGPAQISPPRGW